jgi:ATP/ADP translocase
MKVGRMEKSVLLFLLTFGVVSCAIAFCIIYVKSFYTEYIYVEEEIEDEGVSRE